VKDLQDTVAEIDSVSVLQPPGRHATGNPRARIKIAGKLTGIDRLRRERLDVAVRRITSAKQFGFGWVDQDVVETVTGADVVPMGVRLQDSGTPRRERSNETDEVAGTCTCVQHSNFAAAFDQVALDVFAMMRLANHGHRVRKPPHVEPSFNCHARLLPTVARPSP
jgi:hypothetical protein